MWPTVTSAAIVTALVLIAVVAAGGELGGVPASAAASWLAVHQVPVTIGGSSLSVLPLLPTGLLVWATARSTTSATAAGRDPRWVLPAAVGGPVALAVLALVLISVFDADLPLAGPSPVPAVLAVLAVHLLGGLLGLAHCDDPRADDLRARVRRVLPGWLSAAVMLVPRILRELMIAGTGVIAVALVCSAPTVVDLVRAGGGVAGGLGLIVLSIAYLPNVVLGAVSVAVGPGAVLGQSTVTAFGAVHAPLPALPVLAVIPAGTGAWWWPVVLLVPAVVAVRLGRRLAARDTARTEALRMLGAGAVLAGVALALLGTLAGGTLGTGTFSPARVPALALGAATVVWLAVLGGAALLLWQRRSTGADLAEETDAGDG